MVPETYPHPNVYSMMLLIKTEVKIPFIYISSPRVGERLSEDSQQTVLMLFTNSFTQSVGDGYLRVSRKTEVNQDSVRMTCKQRSDVINFAPKRLISEGRVKSNQFFSTYYYISTLLTLSMLSQPVVRSVLLQFQFQPVVRSKLLQFHPEVTSVLSMFQQQQAKENIPEMSTKRFQNSKEAVQGRFQGKQSMRSKRGVTLGWIE